MASNSLQSELQNLRDRFRVGQDEYLRVNEGKTLDALLIEAGRKDIASPDAVHRLLLKKKFVPKSPETVIYDARFGEDGGTDPNENPSRRLSLIGNPKGAEWFLRLCREGMEILGGVELAGIDPRALSIGLCNLRRGLKWTPAERKPKDLTHAGHCRWLWIMLDIAWRANSGTTLFTLRRFVHPKFDIELPYETEFFQGRCRRKPRPTNFIADEVKWAKQLPDYFHSRINDVFAKSLTMIDTLLRNIDAPVASTRPLVDPTKLQLALEFIKANGPKVGKEVATHIPLDAGTFRRHYVKPLKALGVINERGRGYFVP
ncbi:MAG: hypothetical protein ACKV2Q_27310 [Planctomycetaceae bacterium]